MRNPTVARMRRKLSKKNEKGARLRQILARVSGLRRAPYGRAKLELMLKKVYGKK